MKGLHFWILTLVALAITFTACEDPTEIGTELLDQSDLVNANFVDTLSLDITLEHRAPFQLNRAESNFNPTSNLLGVLQDPLFGTSEAVACMTFGFDENDLQFDSLPRMDSISISIAYFAGSAVRGDASQEQTFYVYEALSNVPSPGESSYPDVECERGELLGQASVMLEIEKDTTEVITIELDTLFGDRLLSKIPDSIFLNADAFQAYFAGVVVVPDESNTAMINFSDLFTTSYMSLNIEGYNADTLRTTERRFGMGISTSQYILDQSGTEIDQLISSETSLTDKVYLQGMGGAQMRVKIPHLLELGDVIINNASIEFSREIDSTMLDTIFLDPVVLEMRLDPQDYSDELDFSNFDYREYVLASVESDSLANKSWLKYNIPMTFSLQRLITEGAARDILIRVKENGVRYSNSTPTTPSSRRGIYNGPTNEDRPMELRIYYTENQ